jgi:hypothetical protein
MKKTLLAGMCALAFSTPSAHFGTTVTCVRLPSLTGDENEKDVIQLGCVRWRSLRPQSRLQVQQFHEHCQVELICRLCVLEAKA